MIHYTGTIHYAERARRTLFMVSIITCVLNSSSALFAMKPVVTPRAKDKSSKKLPDETAIYKKLAVAAMSRAEKADNNVRKVNEALKAHIKKTQCIEKKLTAHKLHQTFWLCTAIVAAGKINNFEKQCVPLATWIAICSLINNTDFEKFTPHNDQCESVFDPTNFALISAGTGAIAFGARNGFQNANVHLVGAGTAALITAFKRISAHERKTAQSAPLPHE